MLINPFSLSAFMLVKESSKPKKENSINPNIDPDSMERYCGTFNVTPNMALPNINSITKENRSGDEVIS